MQLVQKQWSRIARELSERLDSSRLSLKSLSDKSGADYFAVRRFRKNGVIRRSSNALALCTYFGINANFTEERPGSLDEILAEVRATWDGSEAHALLLIELIRSTRPFKVTAQRSSGPRPRSPTPKVRRPKR